MSVFTAPPHGLLSVKHHKQKRCLVCGKITLQLNSEINSSYTIKTALFCSEICNFILNQGVGFVHGFMLCKVVCSLLQSEQNEAVQEAKKNESRVSLLSDVTQKACTFDLDEPECETSMAWMNANQLIISPSEEDSKQLPVVSFKTGLVNIAKNNKLKSIAKDNVCHPKISKTLSKNNKNDNLDDSHLQLSSTLAKNLKQDVSHFGDREYLTCSECSKIMPSKKSLADHLRYFHMNGSLMCKLCNKSCRTKAGLTIHVHRAHKGEKHVQCERCGENFLNAGDLDKHNTVVHKLEKGVCHICGKLFRSQAAWKTHLAVHTGVIHHFCEYCGKGFMRINALCEHRRKVHSKNKSSKCHLCMEMFSNNSNLKRHLSVKHRFSSYFDGSVVKKLQESILSMKTVSDENIDSDDLNIKNSCEHEICSMCNMQRTSCSCPPSTKVYSESDDKELVTCKICGAELHSVKHMFDHMKEHDHENMQQTPRSFLCSACGKNFSTKSYMQIHMQQHQAKRFMCDVCSKTFTYKCNMQKHRETHFRQFSLECEVCHKTFQGKNNLNSHMKQHTRQHAQPFQCHICGKGLTRKYHLLRHMRIMHSDGKHDSNF